MEKEKRNHELNELSERIDAIFKSQLELIQTQNRLINEMSELIKENGNDITKLKALNHKQKMDINNAFERIREVEFRSKFVGNGN
jgi:hypothetical protein